MSHHSGEPPSPGFLRLIQGLPGPETELERRLKEAEAEIVQSKIGPTGRYPDGHLVPDDQGELVFELAHGEGKVVMIFNAPIQWIGFTPQQARELADGLQKLADAAEREE